MPDPWMRSSVIYQPRVGLSTVDYLWVDRKKPTLGSKFSKPVVDVDNDFELDFRGFKDNVESDIDEEDEVLGFDFKRRGMKPYDKGLQYAKRGVHYTNPQSVRKVLENLTKYGVSNSELCVIANVGPESVDEVLSLVPSLKLMVELKVVIQQILLLCNCKKLVHVFDRKRAPDWKERTMMADLSSLQ
ncbi:hypothetical protein SO802_012779 [Lithocarpus litseifolius]|uniref:Uncharacterized protein n=1 Tax=Lithocarpus litseifolius TaxID=425828 RepID=A0AAW2D690_9ROSI